MDASLQLAMAISPAHRNRYLFSDYYLNSLLPDDARWSDALPETKAFLTWLQKHYAQQQSYLPHYTESQLEDHWFIPILDELDHVFERRPSVPGLDAGVKWPDYVFFPGERERKEAVSAQQTEAYTVDALAVGEVKHWDVPLGKKQRGGGASFEAQNPSWQIDYYLRATGLDWGILSNGRLWRLVHKDTSQRLSIYYEVDLVDLLTQGDAGAMRYFTLFFRQAAFRPDAQGRVFLDDAMAASNAYAVALEEDLEGNVYQALEQLMQGFLDLSANRLGPDNLKEIYDNSLYLLYRLLFILYGESRGLLPLQNDQYRTSYSLTHIKEEIANTGAALAPMTTLYWGHLKNLFHIIDGSDAELNRYLNVPRYNGGLFSPDLHPFLEEKAVGDRALVTALDLLCRRTTTAGREFADYRTLGIRHLGSIYEGLLGYQPRSAHEPMIAIRDGNRERWVAAGQAPSNARVIDRRGAGQVYLETDKGERKATGSYYTPQYIVEYIVENTLGPLVDEAAERARTRAEGVKGKAANTADGQPLVDEILRLKVLDPAMGSGHFLVEVTEFLALSLATDSYVEVVGSAEEDLTYWKRRVVERCIYGVDKNPLAVELAKLSLWLSTVAADRPLSFLDHHLKCGDSLIGAHVADLGWAPSVILSKQAQRQLEQQKTGQINMYEYLLSQKLPVVMGRILEITEVESKDYDTVRAKEAADQAVRGLKAPFKAVADLWISAYFGNEFTTAEYGSALDLVGQPGELQQMEAVKRTQAMADESERVFFHWELEFPEVFYGQNGQRLGDKAGFDAVVGNPPWSAKENLLTEADYDYLRRLEVDNLNYYPYFIVVGLNVLRTGSNFAMVLPDSLLAKEYPRTRKYLLRNHAILEIAHLTQPFEDVDHDVIVLLVKAHVAGEGDIAARIVPQGSTDIEGSEIREIDTTLWDDQESDYRFNLMLDRTVEALSNKLYCVGTEYGEICETHEGIHTRHRRDDIFPEDVATLTPKHKPLLIGSRSGDVIERYHTVWNGRYVNYDQALCTPNAKGMTPDLVDEGWFTQPKLIIVRTGREFKTALDYDHFHLSNNLFSSFHRQDSALHVSYEYLCALLNSRLLQRFLRIRIAPRFGNLYVETKIKHLDVLPIRRIHFTTPQTERECLVADLIVLYKQDEHEALLAEVYELLARNDTGDFLAFQPSATGAEEKSDAIHDLLAYLTEQMIAMHQQKQATVETFWLDLEGVTDAEVFDTLHNKGNWESTLWKANACRPFVDEESRSTKHLDESLGWNEEAFKAFIKELVGSVPNLSELVRVYRTHHSAYQDLVTRIEATDRLIDQIVYQLYGLTEEEIAGVEGHEG